jgi:hypothetical protein
MGTNIITLTRNEVIGILVKPAKYRSFKRLRCFCLSKALQHLYNIIGFKLVEECLIVPETNNINDLTI